MASFQASCRFFAKKFDAYKKQEKIKKGSPTVTGKYALVFCTYSGPHTGVREATFPLLYAGFLNTWGSPYWANGEF